MGRRWLCLGFVFGVAWVGCSDSDGAREACPEGTAVGEVLSCSCGDGGPGGVQTCGDDNTLSPCDCSDAAAAGDGDGDGDTAGGDGDGDGDATMGDGDGAGGDGDATGDGDGDATMGDGDGAGGDGDATGDAGSPDVGDAAVTDAGPGEIVPPADGNQLSLCETDRDCNASLGCYDNGTGRSFCSATCQQNADCEALTGASWTCSNSTGVCQVECSGPEDGESCPEGMACLPLNPLNGGGNANGFRCKWPAAAPERSPAFGPCHDNADCAEGLECFGAFGMAPGFCSTMCQQSDDCAAQPGSGSITASCETLQAGGPMPTGLCALDCSDDEDGCPDGMQCSMGPGFQRCRYNP